MRRRYALVGIVTFALLASSCVYVLDRWLEDPWAHQGAAIFRFFNEREDDEIWIVGLKLGDEIHLTEETAGAGFRVSTRSQRGNIDVASISAPAGRRMAEVLYRATSSEELGVFRFDVDLIAQSQCDVRVVFTANAVRVGECENHREATYGGIWPH